MRFWPDLVLKPLNIKVEVSTTRSDEDCTGPGSTLSLLIVSFHPSGPVINNLAMNYGQVSLKTGPGPIATLESVA